MTTSTVLRSHPTSPKAFKSRSGQINTRLDARQRAGIQSLAKANDMPQATYLRAVIDYAIAKRLMVQMQVVEANGTEAP